MAKKKTNTKKKPTKKKTTTKKKVTKKKLTKKKAVKKKPLKKKTTKKKVTKKRLTKKKVVKKKPLKKKTTKKKAVKKKPTKKKITKKKVVKKKPLKKKSTKKKTTSKKKIVKKKTTKKTTRNKTTKKKIEKKKINKKTTKPKTASKEFKKRVLKGKKVLLTILDGFGIREPARDNAVTEANMPFYKETLKKYSWMPINAQGPFVGLPEGQMGTSEVCHMTIGSGRVIKQDLVRINEEIKNKSFFKNKALVKAMKRVKENNKTLHLIGLCSDGGVHSHINHLFALLEMAKQQELKQKKVLIHVITDGRDTKPRIAKKYISQIKEKCSELGIGRIATIIGRYYAMDRDNRWKREQLAYDALVYGLGLRFQNEEEAININYMRTEGDEFIKPSIIKLKDHPKGYIKNEDSIIFFNFRSDRARQLTRALVDPNFNSFKTSNIKVHMTTFNSYEKSLRKFVDIAFKDENIKNNLAETLSKNGNTQFHTAETEKYAHVTYFFNSGIEKPYPGESRKLIPSPEVATYDLQPQMSGFQVTNEVINGLDREEEFIVVNLANPDMVGHTGKLYSTKKALEFVDKFIKKIKEKSDEKGYLMIITADHGNCEEMSGEHQKSHTLNKVPFIILDKDYKVERVKEPKLSDIAPTILNLMKIKKPKEMTGRIIIKKRK